MQRANRIRNVLVALASLTLIAGALVPTHANAADASAVLNACDDTPNCNYSQSKNGDISGCSVNSGTCFYCPADGKHQCFQVSRGPKHGKFRTGKIGGVKLAPAPSGHRHPIYAGGLKSPVAVKKTATRKSQRIRRPVKTGGFKTKAIYRHTGGPTDQGGKGFNSHRNTGPTFSTAEHHGGRHR